LLRDRLEDGIRALLPDARLNGHPEKRLPNTLNMHLPGYRGESIVLALDQNGIAISSGSACHSGSPEPSHVLRAMGLSDEEVHCSIRASLGVRTTEEEIDRTLACLDEILHHQKQIVRFAVCR
jgi:cysteine sulfinate desulfinase/cysteine desulfurase-like protein